MTEAPFNPSSEALLVHAEWVRRLARSLVLDGHDADDVAQQTWLSTLRRPPLHVRDVRAWFATVMFNVVRRGGKERLLRTHRERQAAQPVAVASPQEIAERVALQRAVSGAVLALDEIYREVVLLRYYEELPPREIAGQWGGAAWSSPSGSAPPADGAAPGSRGRGSGGSGMPRESNPPRP